MARIQDTGRARSRTEQAPLPYGIRYAREPIEEMLQDFHLLTGIRVAYFPLPQFPAHVESSDDANLSQMERIYASPAIPAEISLFCAAIRKDPAINKRCQACDREAFGRAHAMGEPVLYRCHTGLMEAVAPVLDAGRCLGYLMMGQILDSPPTSKAWSETIGKFPHGTVVDPSWEAAFYRLPHMSFDRIQAAFRLLTRQARFLLTSSWVRAQSMPLLARLEEEIMRSPVVSRRTTELARALQISPSRLTHVVKEQTGCSVTQFSHRLRLSLAKSLLLTTEESVGEIAEKAGWQDSRYFARVFRREVGVTAQQFRSSFVHTATVASLSLQGTDV